MKNFNLKWTSMVVAIMLIAFITSCNNAQQEQENTDEAENREMSHMEDRSEKNNNTETVDTEGEPSFIVDYMDIKNALVNDNYEQVKKEASDLQKSIEDSKLTDEQRNKIKSLSQKIAEAENIKLQRQYFAELSKEVYQLVQTNDLSHNTLYWSHCPMALNNSGGNWLSYQKQVENPFMGQRMLKCGSVKETIN